MKKIILNDNNPKNNLLIKYFITLACNNRCPYCFMLPELNNKLKFNPDVFELFKTKINEINREKHFIRLELLGGDPLFIDEINRLKEIDQTNLEFILYSNCNFNPIKFKEKIESLEFKSKIVVSIHQVSNLNYVKENPSIFEEKNTDDSRLVFAEKADEMWGEDDDESDYWSDDDDCEW